MYKKLKNGLKVVVKRVAGVKSLSIAVMVKVGSSHESKNTNGYSHFIEHMNFKGTENMSALEISRRIEGVGGMLNAFTSKDITCYYTKTAGDKRRTAVETLAEIYFNESYREEDLEKEKLVILEEIKMDNDTPDEVCHEEACKAVFSGHSLAMSVLGKENNIKKATRESLLEYKRKHYTANNTCICFCGDITSKEAFSLVDEFFNNKIEKGNKVKKLKKAEYSKKKVEVKKDIEQCHISLIKPSVEIGHDDGMAVTLFSTILGGGMCSRLYQSIRENNGLAYTVYSSTSSYVNNGYFEIYLATNPESVGRAIEEIKTQLDLIKEKGIQEEELIHVKEQLKGNLSLSLENTLTMAISGGLMATYQNKDFDANKKIIDVEKVTLADVNRVALNYTNFEDYSVVVVGK